MLDKITWPVAVTVLGALAAVVVLGLAHVDTGVITNMLTLLGLGGGMGVLMGVRNNVNGNLAKLIDLISTSMDKLAASQPVDGLPATDAPAGRNPTGGE